MDCSKLMSGLSLVEMMLLAVSRYTSVLKGSSSPRLSQPSSKVSRSSLSKRPTRIGARAATAAPLGVNDPAAWGFSALFTLDCSAVVGHLRSLLRLSHSS